MEALIGTDIFALHKSQEIGGSAMLCVLQFQWLGKYLVAILESTGYHGIGRSEEDNKISRLAILEHYAIFQDLKINRVLPNNTDDFLKNLNLFFEFEIINKEHAIDLTDSSKRPGLLIYTISGDNTTGR